MRKECCTASLGVISSRSVPLALLPPTPADPRAPTLAPLLLTLVLRFLPPTPDLFLLTLTLSNVGLLTPSIR